MAIPSPFSAGFPLKSTGSYNSRIETIINSDKNYILLGFKGGFPLQAEELNEIQEQFFVQQTLTQKMINNWIKEDSDTGPGWDGVTPLSPGLITRVGRRVTLNPGWILIKDPDFLGGFGYWIYNNTTKTISSIPTTPNLIYGISVKYEVIDCDDDSTLRDSIGGSTTVFGTEACGADRIKISVVDGIVASTSIPTTGTVFLPLLTVIEDTDNSIQTINGYTIPETV